MNLARLLTYLESCSNKINLDFGEFMLKKPLGQGGNGIVYEAETNGEPVAIKFLVSDATGDTMERKIRRFLAEYLNVITVKENSHLIRYIDYDRLFIDDADGRLEIPVIIMKKYDSSLSHQQLAKNRDQFLHLFKFLLASIQQIHNQGIIHRDIKPENILIDSNGFVLADFGIASYNPSIFKILAKTPRKERLGNRSFSAPEQEEAGIEAHPTMDIYALGQVLQWYATGATHRGTGRISITLKFPGLDLHDRIIDKCLEQSPKKRFQSVAEINSYIEKSKVKDIFTYLHLFSTICRKSFPRNDYRVVYCNDTSKIDRLFTNFKEAETDFDGTLWWVDGSGSFDQFSFVQKDAGIWNLGGGEFNITDVWINYESGCINDFLLAYYKKGEPFMFEGQEQFDTVIVDSTHSISYSEYKNGFAELEGEIIDLSTRKVEFIERQNKNGFFFIGTAYTCVIQAGNDGEIRSLFEKLLREQRLPSIEEVKDFERKVRRIKHDEVRNRL